MRELETILRNKTLLMEGCRRQHAAREIRKVIMKQRNTVQQQILTGHLPLKKAVLCLDCDSISDANQECPACGSGALMNLSIVLNPEDRIQLPAVTQIAVPVAAYGCY
jgi:RNA polymerase subunit RPABC4/transcription elongation factor Spt4